MLLKLLFCCILLFNFSTRAELTPNHTVGGKGPSTPTPPSSPPEDPALTRSLEERCQQRVCESEAIALSVFDRYKDTFRSPRARGYLAIVAVMVATSSFTVFATSAIGDDHETLSKFLTLFFTQVTTLGIYVVGAPIWEPLTSMLREKGYKHVHQHDLGNPTLDRVALEAQHARTNSIVSINSQMSRNIIRDYIQILVENLYHARSNLTAKTELDLIPAQMAEIAMRLNYLYPDVDPTMDVIASAVRYGFTQYLDDPNALLEGVLRILEERGASAQTVAAVRSWLSPCHEALQSKD